MRRPFYDGMDLRAMKKKRLIIKIRNSIVKDAINKVFKKQNISDVYTIYICLQYVFINLTISFGALCLS